MATGALRALIFDVDGTLADTESAHLAAFNQAFAELGLGWVWTHEMYLELLAISGGKERIWHYWQQFDPGITAQQASTWQPQIDRIHALKTLAYERAVSQGAVSLRPGVLSLLDEAWAAGLPLAIATTTTPTNIDALMRHAVGAGWRLRFAAIGDAATAPRKKPHPQVYLQVLAALKLPASACLALEDSSNGLQAALAAGIATVITPNRFTAQQDFHGALRVVPDLRHVSLDRLREWQNSARA